MQPAVFVRLRDVLPEVQIFGDEELRVASCCADSRLVRPGDLFAALAVPEAVAESHAREARRRGAVAVLASRRLPLEGCSVCVVPDPRDAFGRLCHALANHPAQRLRVVGVTGTNGKTTCTHLVASVLQAAGRRCGILGTVGYFDGHEWEPAPLTTPGSAELARWLRRMELAGCTHAAMEVSSHALAQSRLAGMWLDTACVTNVRHDHLDYHGSDEEYRRAKRRIFEHLRPEGVTILNADDPGAAAFLPHVQGPALTVGIRRAAEITATVVEQTLSEQTFLLSAGSETIPVRSRLIAAHNVYNCLVAAAVGLTQGIDLPTVVRGLEAVESVPGRLERIECGQPFAVFVDYAHTADALAGCLETLRALTDRRLICVFGCGGDRDRLKRPVMGRVVAEQADRVILTDDNPRREDPQQIIGDILRGMPSRAHVRVIHDRREAIHAALAGANAGDCVLIAGKGHETCQVLGDDIRPFDDRQCARQWLYDHAGQLVLTTAHN